MTALKLSVDGYHVDDRLEGAKFIVDIDMTDDGPVIGAIAHPTSTRGPKIDWAAYEDDVRQVVSGNIDHMKTWIAPEGITWQQAFDDYAADTGEPGVQLLMEV